MIRIAILDSGDNRFDKLNRKDSIGHGTIVCGIIRHRAKNALIEFHKIEYKGKPDKLLILEALRMSRISMANIINISWTFPHDPHIEKAIAAMKNVLFIGAAGNKGVKHKTDRILTFGEDGLARRNANPQNIRPFFPSNLPNVINVAENGSEDTEEADLYENGSHWCLHGSSFACARVTGRIANYYKAGMSRAEALALY